MGDYRQVVEILRPFNSKQVIDQFTNSFQSPVEESMMEDFRVQVSLPRNGTAILVVVRFFA